ncbi:MAG: CHAT domain-containing protein [Deltaproteobacteria bacterium]|nr:CHAT domain-containing protein [Deltaproteobacteria bacterium]
MNDKNHADGSDHQKIEDIMRERARLDRVLQKKFKKRMAIVFTDVCGYTQYMDTRGDIAGRAWIQKHNDIVLPRIEANHGKVLSLMGDGVMSSFENTLDAAKACIAIQKGLDEYNRDTDAADALHVTIGINAGEILMDEDHIAGDVVNVASRIETKAEADQILISHSAYEDIRGSDDVLCRHHGSVRVKGKDEALELYRVIWQDDEIVVSPNPRVRSGDAWSERRLQNRPSVLQLEVTREDSRLKISALEQEPGEISTVRQYEEIPIPIEKVGNRCNEIVDTLNACNRKGCISRDILTRLRDVGQAFRDELFTPDIKDKIQTTEAEHLIINLDDQLVQIPWELLHDGKQFLCQRFSMGRLVKTRQATAGNGNRRLERPLKALILADPKADLKNAQMEGVEILKLMDQRQDLVSATLRMENITASAVSSKMKIFDMVHFAGHSNYVRENPAESGWRLSDSVLKASDFMKMSGSGVMPALVFSNACQSARTEEWALKPHFHDEIFGLANALILSGVKHYIGTFWEILDEPGRMFALEFYKHLFAGLTVGEAMWRARLALINAYGEETIVWASYLLYGDPTFNYMDQIRSTPKAPEIDENISIEKPVDETVELNTRAQKNKVDPEKEVVKKKSPTTRVAVAGIVVVIALLTLFYSGIFKTDTTQQEQALLAYYTSGNFEQALTAARELTAKNAEIRLSYLVEGDIFLRQGDLEAARTAYEKAMEASKGTDVQKADALIGLGRLASLQNQKDTAIEYYELATRTAPGSSRGFLSQAMLISEKGDAETALGLLKKAHQQDPHNAAITAITNDTRRQVELVRDKKKQQRIDNLVQDLLGSMDQPPRATPGDGWTSQPLTLWIMDFKSKGYSVQEGENTLLLSSLTDQLLQKGRVQIVERALLDKLLGELKLGSSELADRRTALAVGKLMAARLIVSGTIVYSGPHTQVSLRMFETETGRITAAINETMGSSVPVSELAGQITGNLSTKLDEKYPIRGKIVKLDGDTAWMNIGANVGVVEGQTYKAVNQETVLEVVAVASEESAARIPENATLPEAGQAVEILYQ